MTELTEPWADRAFLRDVQYRTDASLAARQSIYSYQEPRIDLQGRVIDLAAPAAGETVCDVGCGNGMYLAELARRGFAAEVLAGRYFSSVTRHDFVSELGIPDPEPVADYVRSMSGTQRSADPERLVAAVLARFPAAWVSSPEISGLNGHIWQASAAMIAKDLFLAKDPNRIGAQILRDHGNIMQTRCEITLWGYQNTLFPGPRWAG